MGFLFFLGIWMSLLGLVISGMGGPGELIMLVGVLLLGMGIHNFKVYKAEDSEFERSSREYVISDEAFRRAYTNTDEAIRLLANDVPKAPWLDTGYQPLEVGVAAPLSRYPSSAAAQAAAVRLAVALLYELSRLQNKNASVFVVEKWGDQDKASIPFCGYMIRTHSFRIFVGVAFRDQGTEVNIIDAFLVQSVNKWHERMASIFSCLVFGGLTWPLYYFSELACNSPRFWRFTGTEKAAYWFGYKFGDLADPVQAKVDHEFNNIAQTVQRARNSVIVQENQYRPS